MVCGPTSRPSPDKSLRTATIKRHARRHLPVVCQIERQERRGPGGLRQQSADRAADLQEIADQQQPNYNEAMTAQTLGFAIQPEDRHVLDELVDYFGAGNRSAYLRATLKVMKSIMIADQLRDSQSYGQQRAAELGLEPADVPTHVQDFLKGSAKGRKK